MYSVVSHAQIPFSRLISSSKMTARGVLHEVVHRRYHELLTFTTPYGFTVPQHVQFHLRPQKKIATSPGTIFTKLKNPQLLDLQTVSPKPETKRGQRRQKLVYGSRYFLRFPQTALPSEKKKRAQINLLKPTGYVMHQQFNIQQLYALPTLYLCVLCLSENKQRLVPLTA